MSALAPPAAPASQADIRLTCFHANVYEPAEVRGLRDAGSPVSAGLKAALSRTRLPWWTLCVLTQRS